MEIYQQSTGPTNAVSMVHDVNYSVCSHREQKYGEDENKNENTRQTEKIVKSLDSIPWKERRWGHALARNAINVK